MTPLPENAHVNILVDHHGNILSAHSNIPELKVSVFLKPAKWREEVKGDPFKSIVFYTGK